MDDAAPDTTTDRLITRAEVERRVGMGPTAIYRGMRAGTFPSAYRVGQSSVRWSAREIEQWVATLPRSHGQPSGQERRGARRRPFGGRKESTGLSRADDTDRSRGGMNDGRARRGDIKGGR